MRADRGVRVGERARGVVRELVLEDDEPGALGPCGREGRGSGVRGRGGAAAGDAPAYHAVSEASTRASVVCPWDMLQSAELRAGGQPRARHGAARTHSWFHSTMVRPKTCCAIARTRLSASPYGARQKRGTRPVAS